MLLPPASPKLQPVERVWPMGDEPVANRVLADLGALEAAPVARRQTLRGARTTIHALTNYWWWPVDDAPPST